MYCREIIGCGHFGTINIHLNQPFDKGRADCWTPKLFWTPGRGLEGDREEEFGFIKVKLEYPIGGSLHDAWIIYPSGHTASYVSRHSVEVIAAELGAYS